MRTVIVGLTLVASAAGCTRTGGGKVTTSIEVTAPDATEAREAHARAVLESLPSGTLTEHLRRKVPQPVLDLVTVSTRTRTERTHNAGSPTKVRVLLECEVSHRDHQDAASEVADACREELEAALQGRAAGD